MTLSNQARRERVCICLLLLAPGKEKTIKLMMAWYTPESDLTVGAVGPDKENCDPALGCCSSPDVLNLDKYDKNFDGPFYKPWYGSRFNSINEVVDYWRQHYNELRDNSTLFKDAFYSSTLPPEVIEAVAANLTILKSPTVMRQYDGRLWSFEGCDDNRVAVMVHAPMYGIMRRPFLICFLLWKEVCVTQNFVKIKMQKAIKISGPGCQ